MLYEGAQPGDAPQFFLDLEAPQGRAFFSATHRFGFQGMEQDAEVKGFGNHYTTEFRQYDPRLGRWFSPDPIHHPWQSPYSAFDCNPVGLTDPYGLSTEGGGDATIVDAKEDDAFNQPDGSAFIAPAGTKSVYLANRSDVMLTSGERSSGVQVGSVVAYELEDGTFVTTTYDKDDKTFLYYRVKGASGDGKVSSAELTKHAGATGYVKSVEIGRIQTNTTSTGDKSAGGDIEGYLSYLGTGISSFAESVGNGISDGLRAADSWAHGGLHRQLENFFSSDAGRRVNSFKDDYMIPAVHTGGMFMVEMVPTADVLNYGSVMIYGHDMQGVEQSRGLGTAIFILSVAPGGDAMKYIGRYSDEVLCFIRKNCFLAGTIIWTPDGVILIERLEPGDTVLAFNTANDSLGAKIVLQTFARETDRLLYLEAAGDTIWTTPEHPFWTGRQWVPAGRLAKGDSLYLASGEFTAIDSIARVDSSAKVYNFEVADWHNYFVASSGALVHNTCPGAQLARHGNMMMLRQLAGKTIDAGKQGKHLPGAPGNASKLTVAPQDLLDYFHRGGGEILHHNPGRFSLKVDFKKPIGDVLDESGNIIERGTSIGSVKYKRPHIHPTRR